MHSIVSQPMSRIPGSKWYPVLPEFDPPVTRCSPPLQDKSASGRKGSTGISGRGKGVSRGRRTLRLTESSSDGSSLPLTSAAGRQSAGQVPAPVPPSGASRGGVVDGLEVEPRGLSAKSGVENRDLLVEQQMRKEASFVERKTKQSFFL